jgi:hypothetical protein
MRKFHRGCTYRHNTSGDLDIYIVSVPYFDEARSKLKVIWVSKRTGKFVYFPGGRADGVSSIEIKADDYKYWTQLKK